jgi:hypothetical protein
VRSERWLPAVGYEGRYEVSDQGRLRALFCARNQVPPPRLLRPSLNVRGYLSFTLAAADGCRSNVRVHTLVLNAFVGPRQSGHCCRHSDGDRLNNALLNLAWGTYSENEADKKQHGTCRRQGLAARPSAKLMPTEVDEIRRRIKAGETQRSIALGSRISRSAVNRIALGTAWGWHPATSEGGA